MDTKEILKSQYHAALEMLGQAVNDCPEALWLAEGYPNHFWQVAYHALFYTHLYLHSSGQDFKPWEQHREESEFLGPLPWPPHRQPKPCEPYTHSQVLSFLKVCHRLADQQLSSLDLEAGSGFDWLPFNKTELQIYNLRHLQQHTGELCERLGMAGINISWVGSRPAA